MNEELVLTLVEVVNAQVRCFNELLVLLQQEQQAIVDDDIERIDASVADQKKIAVHAHDLEADRQHTMEQLSTSLHLEPQSATLSRLLEVIDAQHGAELAHMRDVLRDLNEKIRTTNDNNAFLIRQSLRYTERNIDILTGQPAGRSMYGQFGRACRKTPRSLLNQRA